MWLYTVKTKKNPWQIHFPWNDLITSWHYKAWASQFNCLWKWATILPSDWASEFGLFLAWALPCVRSWCGAVWGKGWRILIMMSGSAIMLFHKNSHPATAISVLLVLPAHLISVGNLWGSIILRSADNLTDSSVAQPYSHPHPAPQQPWFLSHACVLSLSFSLSVICSLSLFWCLSLTLCLPVSLSLCLPVCLASSVCLAGGTSKCITQFLVS